MIVYRKQEVTKASDSFIRQIRRLIRQVRNGFPHELAVELLIAFGELETGVTDCLCPAEESDSPLLRELRAAGTLAGHLFSCTWKKETDRAASFLDALENSIERFRHLIPGKVRTRIPEGYAHYGLFPETYLEAASRLFRAESPERTVCIGMRSIGTSLSAVVAARLEELGCSVVRFTMRPHGHPFDREIKLSPSFASLLSAMPCSHFILVDEGPGLSGSSFGCSARALSELGIGDDRVVFLPSWIPDGNRFISENAKKRWPRHRKYSAAFEEVWLPGGRLLKDLPAFELRDISAGMWRRTLYPREDLYPAVHPHLERRKYSCTIEEDRAFRFNPVLSSGSGKVILKFAGLGRYGRFKLSRAHRLYDAGFSQLPLGLTNGFIATRFVEGRPLIPGSPDQRVLDTLAFYIDFVGRNFPASQDARFDELAGMIRRNTGLGLGTEWEERLGFLEQYRAAVSDAPSSAIDGRMLPHEWLETPAGLIKTDCLDHHADQFFPGCQNVAWDIAGAVVEFGMQHGDRDYLVNRYCSLSRDRDLHSRLPFYLIAYLAFRLGYVTFALREFGATPEGERFKKLASAYSEMLRTEISGITGERS